MFKCQIKEKKTLVYTVSGFLVVWLIEVCLSILATRFDITAIHKHIYDLIDVSSPFPLLIAIPLFCTFLKRDIKSCWIAKTFGTCTLGIYMFHEHPLFRYLIWDNVFHVDYYYDREPVIYVLHMLVVIVLLFALGTLFNLIITNIWKLINRKAERFLTVLNDRFQCFISCEESEE